LGLLAAARPPASPPGADLTGRVEILDKDKKHTPGANSVVWIPGLAAPAPATAAMPDMASQDKRFTPHILAVTAGTEVSFPNRDPIFHNVFSLTPEDKFDLGLYRKGAAKSVRLTTPALVRIYCNIHADMAAFVMVLDRAQFVVTEADGSYRLPAIPAGQYEVHAWNERTGEQAQTIAIASGGLPVDLNFFLDASAYKPQAHKNKFGRDYPPVSKDVDRY
jgi:plastocyanin